MAEVKRRWFWRPRFTLAAMLVLITVFAIPLGYVAQRRVWNLKRKAAYATLIKQGIGLPNNLVPATKPTWWQWLIADEPDIAIHGVMAQCDSHVRQDIPSITAADLQLLAYFPEIESLCIWGPCEAGDEAFDFLERLPNLKSLSVLEFSNLRGGFLGRLRCERNLEGLTLHSLEKLEGEYIPNFERFSSLDALDVSWCPLLNDQALRKVNLPSTVKYLTVAGDIGDETLLRWLKQGQLEHLWLDTSMSRRSASFLDRQVHLNSIRITNAPWIDDDFYFLKNCRHLEELILTSMPVKGAFLDWLPKPEGIRKLNFCNTLFADTHIAKIAKFEKLNRLELCWTPLTGTGFSSLKDHPSGCHIRLVGTRFTDEGKKALAECPTIDSLWGAALPANWTAEEMALLGNKNEYGQFELPADAAVDVKRLLGEYPLFYILRDESHIADPIDRCPLELMAPVFHLHELARQAETREKEIDAMIKEEGRVRLIRVRGGIMHVREGSDGTE